MKKNGDTVSYTASELKELVAREGDQSDWAAAAAMRSEEVEAAIASDPDEASMVVDWSTVRRGAPSPKELVSIRFDPEVLSYFKKAGRGYQTRINNVLLDYVRYMGSKSH
jgi:uncharacterized protein (DUF4415 family)